MDYAVLSVLSSEFLNVLVYRSAKLSSVKGTSFCPQCGHRLKWYDLFPMLSYLFFGQMPVPGAYHPRYPAVEG